MTTRSKSQERRFISGKPATLSGRPPVHEALTDQLLEEGWAYDITIGEWVKDANPLAGPNDRGRICWSDFTSEAWLRHPAGADHSESHRLHERDA